MTNFRSSCGYDRSHYGIMPRKANPDAPAAESPDAEKPDSVDRIRSLAKAHPKLASKRSVIPGLDAVREEYFQKQDGQKPTPMKEKDWMEAVKKGKQKTEKAPEGDTKTVWELVEDNLGLILGSATIVVTLLAVLAAKSERQRNIAMRTMIAAVPQDMRTAVEQTLREIGIWHPAQRAQLRDIVALAANEPARFEQRLRENAASMDPKNPRRIRIEEILKKAGKAKLDAGVLPNGAPTIEARSSILEQAARNFIEKVEAIPELRAISDTVDRSPTTLDDRSAAEVRAGTIAARVWEAILDVRIDPSRVPTEIRDMLQNRTDATSRQGEVRAFIDAGWERRREKAPVMTEAAARQLAGDIHQAITEAYKEVQNHPRNQSNRTIPFAVGEATELHINVGKNGTITLMFEGSGQSLQHPGGSFLAESALRTDVGIGLGHLAAYDPRIARMVVDLILASDIPAYHNAGRKRDTLTTFRDSLPAMTSPDRGSETISTGYEATMAGLRTKLEGLETQHSSAMAERERIMGEVDGLAREMFGKGKDELGQSEWGQLSTSEKGAELTRQYEANETRLRSLTDEIGRITERVEHPQNVRNATVGDLHGNYDGYRYNLRASGITDAAGNWTFGRGRVHMIGDIVADRHAQGFAILRDIVRLRRQARVHGGDIITYAGNHENFMLAYLAGSDVAGYRGVGGLSASMQGEGQGKGIFELFTFLDPQRQQQLLKLDHAPTPAEVSALIEGTQWAEGGMMPHDEVGTNLMSALTKETVRQEIVANMRGTQEGMEILGEMLDMRLVTLEQGTLRTHTPVTLQMAEMILDPAMGPDRINQTCRQYYEQTILGIEHFDETGLKQAKSVVDTFVATDNRPGREVGRRPTVTIYSNLPEAQVMRERMHGSGIRVSIVGHDDLKRRDGTDHGSEAVEKDGIRLITSDKGLGKRGTPQAGEAPSLVVEDMRGTLHEAQDADNHVRAHGLEAFERLESLYSRAVDYILGEHGVAHTSPLQNALQIDYDAAEEILQRMEREGLIGPEKEVGKPQEKLMSLQQWKDRESGTPSVSIHGPREAVGESPSTVEAVRAEYRLLVEGKSTAQWTYFANEGVEVHGGVVEVPLKPANHQGVPFVGLRLENGMTVILPNPRLGYNQAMLMALFPTISQEQFSRSLADTVPTVAYPTTAPDGVVLAGRDLYDATTNQVRPYPVEATRIGGLTLATTAQQEVATETPGARAWNRITQEWRGAKLDLATPQEIRNHIVTVFEQAGTPSQTAELTEDTARERSHRILENAINSWIESRLANNGRLEAIMDDLASFHTDLRMKVDGTNAELAEAVEIAIETVQDARNLFDALHEGKENGNLQRANERTRAMVSHMLRGEFARVGAEERDAEINRKPKDRTRSDAIRKMIYKVDNAPFEPMLPQPFKPENFEQLTGHFAGMVEGHLQTAEGSLARHFTNALARAGAAIEGANFQWNNAALNRAASWALETVMADHLDRQGAHLGDSQQLIDALRAFNVLPAETLDAMQVAHQRLDQLSRRLLRAVQGQPEGVNAAVTQAIAQFETFPADREIATRALRRLTEVTTGPVQENARSALTALESSEQKSTTAPLTPLVPETLDAEIKTDVETRLGKYTEANFRSLAKAGQIALEIKAIDPTGKRLLPVLHHMAENHQDEAMRRKAGLIIAKLAGIGLRLNHNETMATDPSVQTPQRRAAMRKSIKQGYLRNGVVEQPGAQRIKVVEAPGTEKKSGGASNERTIFDATTDTLHRRAANQEVSPAERAKQQIEENNARERLKERVTRRP